MTIKEPDRQFKILPTDVVSGRLYLKLIEDYKEYDKQQKEYISSLERKVFELTHALNESCSITKKTLLEKLERKSKGIRERELSIKKLKDDNEQLLIKLAQINLTQSK